MTKSKILNFTPDQLAAHEFLTELRTRIATQPLPFRHGNEEAALTSLYALFELGRNAIKEHPGCVDFADLTVEVLNTKIRPVTAKWHRKKLEGLLNTRDGAIAFRADLAELQIALQAYANRLRDMAYGENSQHADIEEEEQDNVDRADSDTNSVLRFGIPGNGLIDATTSTAINESEAQEINAIRDKNGNAAQPKGGPLVNVVGLAFSGGGIRSASFCLGVAQVLADKKLFKDIDIMSTVSGGSYIGAFITQRLGSAIQILDPDQQEVSARIANPFGPDTLAVAYLRKRAAYLYMGSNRAAFVAACRIIAGMIHNWTAPAFFISLGALICVYITTAFDISWDSAPLLAGMISIFGLLMYALTSQWRRTIAESIFALALSLATFVMGCWLVHLIYESTTRYTPMSAPWVTLGAVLVATFPALSRSVPYLKTPLVANMLNAGVLIIAAAAVPIIGLALGFLFYELGSTPFDAESSSNWQLTGYVSGNTALIIITLLLTVLASMLNINATSPHMIYRDGLSRTFIAQNDSENGDVALTDLNQTHNAPYHLINAAVNLPSSKEVKLRERKSDFFVFSKCWSGSPATGYYTSDTYKNDNQGMDLATAVAISGAAVSPHMALNSIRSARMLLSFLNLRLSFWVKNPSETSFSIKRVPGIQCLIREMLGVGMSETKAWLNLSDGGHIENLGVYELLRRRCKYIVAVDAGQDADNTFESLTTLIRHAQIDFGIKITPAFDDLRKDAETCLSPAHAVLTKINYPATNTEAEGSGLLLIIKLSLTGDENELINGYRSAYPNFPHQSTADQFFDEAQFEVYRQLGVHSVEGLFAPALIGKGEPPEKSSEWLERLADTIME